VTELSRVWLLKGFLCSPTRVMLESPRDSGSGWRHRGLQLEPTVEGENRALWPARFLLQGPFRAMFIPTLPLDQSEGEGGVKV
jgi:hypothetical protein